MIDLPEALTIARQMNEALRGKTIAAAIRGNAPHKFTFYTGTPEQFATLLPGKVIGRAREYNADILIDLEPGYALALGDGGLRIVLHQNASTVPARHQLLLQFVDGTFLAVTVQMYGIIKLLAHNEIAASLGEPRISALDLTFTYDAFADLWSDLALDDPRSIKYFIISKPGIRGVGNGYLQDILFRAKLHPRRRAVDLDEGERRALYAALRHTLGEGLARGGRESQPDLFGRPGGYHCLLDRHQLGWPCPSCGTPIAKFSYLGGSCYICPNCQPEPVEPHPASRELVEPVLV